MNCSYPKVNELFACDVCIYTYTHVHIFNEHPNSEIQASVILILISAIVALTLVTAVFGFEL